jgi:hypothetical protein
MLPEPSFPAKPSDFIGRAREVEHFAHLGPPRSFDYSVTMDNGEAHGFRIVQPEDTRLRNPRGCGGFWVAPRRR